VVDFPDKEAYVTWLHALYGAAMLAVQQLEQAISLVYAVGHVDPTHRSNASPQRQWRDATTATWRAFQQGTAGMKLNDASRGIKQYLDPDLHAEVEQFITGPRNQLAHRFLIERVPGVDQNGMPALMGAAAELIAATLSAKRLSDALMRRADEIRSEWPVHVEPPQEIQDQLEAVARATLFKQFPREFVEKAAEIQRFQQNKDQPGEPSA
jgi:hypothetical protein